MNLDAFTNHKEFNYNINVEFDTVIEQTERIIEVSNAFGLGINEAKKFSVYKDFNIGFNRDDVVYITGDSGGGKTILLQEIINRLEPSNEKILFLDDVTPCNDEVVIESIGDTMDESIYYLSMMGLNDAYIFLRKYGELSDGQKYRYRLAKAIGLKPDFLFIDEFCCNLDRTTAKVISYNLQRVARKNNMGVFVATTHTDILEDLNPSVLVTKSFMNNVRIQYLSYTPKKISFYNDVEFKTGCISDYKRLSKYHYKNTGTNFPYCNIVSAWYKNDIVGVAVFSPPFLQTKGRTIKFDKKYSMMTKDVVRDINKLFIRGSRYVISPKYRACGLGQRLVNESMTFIKNKKYLEVVTVMGKYNPVFEKCGMEKIEITEETDSAAINLDKWLKETGCDVVRINNGKYLKQFVDGLSPENKNVLKLLTGKVLHHPKIGLSSKDGKRAEVVKQEKRYKETIFNDVYNEILTYIPKLYSGMSIYYICELPENDDSKEVNLENWEVKK